MSAKEALLKNADIADKSFGRFQEWQQELIMRSTRSSSNSGRFLIFTPVAKSAKTTQPKKSKR